METWKLFKIRIKLLLEKIQLNFLSWLEIIYLALSIIFGLLTLVKLDQRAEHSFFFFQPGFSGEFILFSPIRSKWVLLHF